MGLGLNSPALQQQQLMGSHDRVSQKDAKNIFERTQKPEEGYKNGGAAGRERGLWYV